MLPKVLPMFDAPTDSGPLTEIVIAFPPACDRTISPVPAKVRVPLLIDAVVPVVFPPITISCMML